MWNARAGLWGLWLALIGAGSALAADPMAVIYEVEAGAHPRRNTPVMVPLPETMRDGLGFTLENLDDHTFQPVQSMAYRVNGFIGVCWIVRAPLAAGATRRYRLSTGSRMSPTQASGGVHARADGKPPEHGGGSLDRARIGTLMVGERPVLTYQAATAEPPAGIDPVFRRSGFIHPLQTPSGLVVTDDFPPDHAHQHGLFFAWVNTTFDGRHVDFWNQKLGTGRIARLTGPEAYGNAIAGGPVCGEVIATLVHEDTTAPEHPKPVLREVWNVLVYDLPGPFVIDFTSAQHAIDEPLTVNQYHYGGLGLRGNRRWFDPTVKGDAAPDPARSGRSDFLTSDGKRRADGNHTRPRWVDLSGAVDGKVGGVAILDHPSNFRFPQPVRLHPSKPYFCFAPMVDGGFTIKRGEPYVSRYRLVVHDGPPDPDAIERLWRDYAEPPRVRIVEDKE